jgi:hypothetical protein
MKSLFYVVVLLSVLTLPAISITPAAPAPDQGIQQGEEVAARYHSRGRASRFFKRGRA